MGEGNKEEKEGNKEEKEEYPPEIVLKVDMHCEACARKVVRALKGFEGVEEVTTDSKAGRVVVKGKAADSRKVRERLQKRSGRKVELISPLPKPPGQTKQEEAKVEETPKEHEKKDESPALITVVLKVGMHCKACAHVLQKRIRKIQGVETVEVDVGGDKVTVKGLIDPKNLVDYVYKRTGKQATIIVKDEDKKKDEEKKDEKEEEEKEAEKKVKDGEGGDDGSKLDIKKSEYWPSKYYMEYVNAYPPQIFSDENPNACFVM